MQLSLLCFVTEPLQSDPSRRVATLLPIFATIANHSTQEGMSRFCIVTYKFVKMFLQNRELRCRQISASALSPVTKLCLALTADK